MRRSMRRSDRKKAKKKSRWVRPRIRRGFSYRAPESGSPALGKIVPRRRATAMRAYSEQKPPSGSASINISESFFRNFSKNPTVDRSARPEALETEPIADGCEPLRGGCQVCVCRSGSPHAAEGRSASPLSVCLCLAPLSPPDAWTALGGRSADVVLVA